MERQTSTPEIELRPPWMDEAERGLATLGKIMTTAEIRNESPRIGHAYDSSTSRLERQTMRTELFFAGQLVTSFPQALTWFNTVLSDDYLQGLGTSIPTGGTGARNLVNIANLTDQSEQRQLLDIAQTRVAAISRVRQADPGTWPWPLQSLFVHEMGSQLQGGSFNNVQLLAQAEFYGGKDENHKFLQALVRTLPERIFSLESLAEKAADPITGRLVNSTYVPYFADPHTPDRIAIIGSTMKLFRQQESQHPSRLLPNEVAARLTSIVLENTLAYTAQFAEKSNAKQLLERLRGGTSTAQESSSWISPGQIVAVASDLSKVALPEDFAFRPFESVAGNLLPAADRILFAATQLGSAREAYWADPSLRRVVTTMHDAMWVIGKRTVLSALKPTVSEALAHHALSQPPNEAMRLAYELGRPDHVDTKAQQ